MVLNRFMEIQMPNIPWLNLVDFECPYCGMVAPELKKIVDENPDVKLLFKHYPLQRL